MRRKAEKQIREAVVSLGRSELYRIDKIREKTTLIKKVFDKTILDMARVRTIELYEGDRDKMSGAEIGNMIQKGDFLYMYISFFESFEDLKATIESGEIPQNSSAVIHPQPQPDRLRPSAPDPPPPRPARKKRGEETETMDIILMGIEKEEWERFETLCLNREQKSGIRKITEMIQAYNRS